MEAFAVGWCLSAFWAVIIVPIFIVKTSLSVPLD